MYGTQRTPPMLRNPGMKVTSWSSKISLKEWSLALVTSHSEISWLPLVPAVGSLGTPEVEVVDEAAPPSP